jgi:hypothetical protein
MSTTSVTDDETYQSTGESVLKFPPLKLSRSRGHTKFLLIVNILIIEIVSQTRNICHVIFYVLRCLIKENPVQYF